MDTLPVMCLCVVMCQLARRLGLAGTHILSRVLGACLALESQHATMKHLPFPQLPSSFYDSQIFCDMFVKQLTHYE
jgi:hypothetical protein